MSVDNIDWENLSTRRTSSRRRHAWRTVFGDCVRADVNSLRVGSRVAFSTIRAYVNVVFDDMIDEYVEIFIVLFTPRAFIPAGLEINSLFISF